MSQCKPDPSKFARSRFASRAPSTCRTCMLACDGSEAAVNAGTDQCFRPFDDAAPVNIIDGVWIGSYSGAPGPAGTPGGVTMFDTYQIW